MSKLWEVDPQTKAKLQELQKINGNSICVDCGAPSPQWASPKFGIFMCLNCSGIHRGLGVHISFIRSVTMDGFKVSELKRMQAGGNTPWQTFYNSHKDNQLAGRTFENATIKDRYDSEAGEEWKERLSAKAEDREYVPGTRSSNTAATSRSQTPVGKMQQQQGIGSGGAGTPGRSASPFDAGSRKAQNETYFARMGAENASRPEGLAPNQGGKYGGFGSGGAAPPQSAGSQDWLGTLQKDPVAGLTKSFGWLGKSAKTGYEGWVKPNVQKLAESDFSAQARLTAAQLGQNLTQTVAASTRVAADSLSRFVEGDDSSHHTYSSLSTDPSVANPVRRDNIGAQPDGDRREFWDSFGGADEPGSTPGGGIVGGVTGALSGSTAASSRRAEPTVEKKDFWDAFGQPAGGASSGAGMGGVGSKEIWSTFEEAGRGVASVGTAAIKRVGGAAASVVGGVGGGGASTGGGGSSGGVGAGSGEKKGKEDDWNEW